MRVRGKTVRETNPNLIGLMYFIFKTVPVAVSGMSIYFGYRLFILGVTGEASLSVNTKTLSGQLLNAAPGLFFAIGGLVALIIIISKGVEVDLSR